MFHLLDELGFSSEESWILGKPSSASGLGFTVDQYSASIDELSTRLSHRSFGSSLDPSITMSNLPPLDERYDQKIESLGWNIRISNPSIEQNQRIFCLSTQNKVSTETDGFLQAWMIQDRGNCFDEQTCEYLEGSGQIIVGGLAKGVLVLVLEGSSKAIAMYMDEGQIHCTKLQPPSLVLDIEPWVKLIPTWVVQNWQQEHMPKRLLALCDALRTLQIEGKSVRDDRLESLYQAVEQLEGWLYFLEGLGEAEFIHLLKTTHNFIEQVETVEDPISPSTQATLLHQDLLEICERRDRLQSIGEALALIGLETKLIDLISRFDRKQGEQISLLSEFLFEDSKSVTSERLETALSDPLPRWWTVL